MAFGSFTLTGEVRIPGGAPATGKIKVESVPRVLTDSSGNKVWASPKFVVLDTLGKFSIQLPTDSTSGDSTAIGWRITPDFKHSGTTDPSEFYAKANGSTLDLADVVTQVIEPVGDTTANRVAAQSAQVAAESARDALLATVVTAGSYRNGVRSDAQILEAAVAALAPGATLLLERGRTYTLTASLYLQLGAKSDVTIDFNGATVDGSAITGEILTIRGGAIQTTLTTATAGIAQRATSITVASASGISAGDVLVVHSLAKPGATTNGEPFNDSRPTTDMKGELVRVASVAGSTITLTQPTYDSYNATDYIVSVSRITVARNLRVTGLRELIGGGIGKDNTGLQVTYFDGLTVDRCSATACENTGISAALGYGALFERCTPHDNLHATLGYGIYAKGIDGLTFRSNTGLRNRHSFDAGVSFGPARNVLFDDNAAIDNTASGISTHSADIVRIVRNFLRDCGGGIVTRSSNTEIAYNTVRGTKTQTQSPSSYLHGIFVPGAAGITSGAGSGIGGTGLNIHDNDVDVTNPRQATDNNLASAVLISARVVGGRVARNLLRGFGSHGVNHRGNGSDGLEITDNDVDCAAQVGTSGVTALDGIHMEQQNSTDTGNGHRGVVAARNKVRSPLRHAVFVRGGAASNDVSDEVSVVENRVTSPGSTPVALTAGFYGPSVEVARNKLPTLATGAAVLTKSGGTFARQPQTVGNDVAASGAGRLVAHGEQQGGRLRPGFWYAPAGYVTGALTPTVGHEYAVPFYVSRSVTVTSIAVNVTTASASSTVRLGLRADADDGVGGYPAGVVVDAGIVATTATGLASASVSVTLEPGLYWLTAVTQAGSPALSNLGGPNPIVGAGTDVALLARAGYRQTGVTGALPSTFSTTGDAPNGVPLIQVKIAA